MREFFSQFGKVVDSTVMLDRETGRSKGFGFVSFEDTDVTPFLGFGNLEIDGKLVCFNAIPALCSLCSSGVVDRCQARSASFPT
jgi:RNA recognition motif. (a.k.a. RRM, RBD, or RNP domain)